ncbi:MAG: MotA/TolQ/ExbB proton channel family protein [Bdellovibrionales bacterium]|nr:MotA/TolQ/ExbB proton channel family protein [Bdellovibrionales bacterium]
MSTLIQHFQAGGIFMYFILLAGVFALTIGIERALSLYASNNKAVPDFRKHILNYLSRGDITGAHNFAVASAAHSALSRTVAKGLEIRASGGGDDEVQARMDEQLSTEISSIDKKTGFLGMIGNVATLLGLLGTISGMISSFAAVAQASPMDRATLLSKGISEAMNCTAFGLVVAIPALVAYAIFQNRTDKIITALTEGTTQTYNDILYLSDSQPSSGTTTTRQKATNHTTTSAAAGLSS